MCSIFNYVGHLGWKALKGFKTRYPTDDKGSIIFDQVVPEKKVLLKLTNENNKSGSLIFFISFSCLYCLKHPVIVLL